MAGFKPGNSGVRSDCSANYANTPDYCATTIVQSQILLLSSKQINHFYRKIPLGHNIKVETDSNKLKKVVPYVCV